MSEASVNADTTASAIDPDGTHLVKTVEQKRRERNFGIAYLIGAAIAVFVFAQTSGTATFGIDDGTIGIAAVPLAWICAITLAALGGAQIVRGTGKASTALMISAGVLFVASFLAWATAGSQFSLTGMLEAAVKASTPLVFGALAGILCERSGVINIAIEGLLLAGAFTSAVVGSLTNLWVGILAATLVSAALGWVLAVLAIRYKVDQIIIGFAINFFVLGVTSFVDSRVLTKNPDYNNVKTLGTWDIPLLADIPIIGGIFFQQSMYVYVAYALVAIITYGLFKTRWGLRTRAVGEHPKAAGTLGVDVLRVRYRNVMLGGAVAGFGGSWWTADLGRFNENITNGRGFIALAVVLVGRYNPVGALAAATMFGFADALKSKLGFLSTGIPSEFLSMAPYLVTLIVVAGFGRGARPPKAGGKPYELD